MEITMKATFRADKLKEIRKKRGMNLHKNRA